MLIVEEQNNKYNNILIIKPHGKMIIDDLNLFILKFNHYMESYESFKCIFDLRIMNDSPLDLTIKLGAYMKKNRKNIKNKLLYSIIIINNNLVKQFLNVLFSIVEPASPYYITNNIEDINQYICM